MGIYTEDILFNGAITVKQKTDGYRFTIDPVLLAHFVKPETHDRIIDMGTGTGIIPLVLSYRHPFISVTGLELQEDLEELARKNVEANGLSGKIRIFKGDMNDPGIRKSAGLHDLAVSNPPYIPLHSGRLNPIREKALARHEITVNLAGLVETAAELLKPLGRFAMIFPQNRKDELLSHLSAGGFSPARLRSVKTLKHGPVKRILVESVKGGNTTPSMEPALVIFEKQGQYSTEVAAMFR
jgi:tRNA1Val (adenine37-N6)-methyltransferase